LPPAGRSSYIPRREQNGGTFLSARVFDDGLASVVGPAERQAPSFAVTRYQLDNGLEVLLHEDHTVALSYLQGSLTPDRFDDQRDVVRNERRQNYDNVAFGRERFAIAGRCIPRVTPIGR